MDPIDQGFSRKLLGKLRSSLWSFLKRFFPPGSLGRKLYYQWRVRFGRSILRLDHRQSLPIDKDLKRFSEWVHAQEAARIVLILASTKLIEIEGQRSTNLALEFARRGIPVIFGYWRWRSDDWCSQDYIERGILQIPVDVIAEWPEMIFRAFHVPERIAVFEFPHPAFFRVLAEAHASGWLTVYDVVDDWEEFQRVGQADWYDRQFEAHLAATADAVTVINRKLAQQLRLFNLAETAILPNGFAVGVERIDCRRELERGQVTIGYFGYLAGAWFDWQLLSQAARSRPDWRFYLIGYGGEPEGISLPGNIILLGKKPRSELASYAANWDVAIIPFKAERLAAGADPIKTYEYLAMGLPVVVTGVYPPEGGEPFVQRAISVEGFVSAIEQASNEESNQVNLRKAFAESCTWRHRVDAFFTLLECGEQRIAEKRALFQGER